MYATIAEVRAANRAAGQHFFAPSTSAFFGSRIGRTLYGGRYFITSENNAGRNLRRYTVRCALRSGEIITASEYGQFGDRNDAIAYATMLANDAQ